MSPLSAYQSTPSVGVARGVGGAIQWMWVEPGAEQAFDFSAHSKRRHQDTRSLIVHQLLVRVEGWSQIDIPVSVDKIGVFFREVCMYGRGIFIVVVMINHFSLPFFLLSLLYLYLVSPGFAYINSVSLYLSCFHYYSSAPSGATKPRNQVLPTPSSLAGLCHLSERHLQDHQCPFLPRPPQHHRAHSRC